MLHKVFAFSDRRVRELMVPRTDMQVLPVTATFAEVVRLVVSEQHTRMPVYEDSIDDIIGVLNAKDLFQFLADDRSPADFDLRALLRPVPFVPESKAVDDLLAEMKKSRTQMAIVMDEFGGTAGLISLEDLLEELVGEIEDEFDEPEVEIVPLDTGVYRLDGKVRIVDFNERFGTELSSEDYDTIAGLVFGQLGREPLLEDVVEFERHRLVVEAMEGHRITSLRLYIRLEEPAAEGEASGSGEEA
jgi:putative hemolysin